MKSISNSNQRKLGVVLSYLSVCLSTVLSLVYTPILLRKLGQEEYGVYTLVASTVAYLSLLSLGFGSAYVRFYSRFAARKDQEGERRLNGMYLLLFSVMGVAALILGMILAMNVDKLFKALTPDELALAERLFIILVISTAVSFPLSVFDSIITAHEKFIFLKLLIMLRRVLNPCLVLLLLLLGYHSEALVMVNLFLTLVTGAASVYYVLRVLRAGFDFRSMDFKLIREMGGYSFYVFLIMIADQISWNVDKFLLGVFQGSAQIAIYGVAAQLNSYFLTFSDVIANVFTPRVHALAEEKRSEEKSSELMLRVGRVQFYIVMLIFLGYVFLGRPFIKIWAGSEYAASYWIGIVLMSGILLPLTEAVSGEILRAKGYHKQYTRITCVGTIGNLALSIPLCIRWGALGCAIGTTVAFFLCQWIIKNIYLKRKAGIDIGVFLRQMLRLLIGTVPAVVCGILILLFAEIQGYLSLAVYGVAFCLVFFAGVWLLDFDPREKELVRAPLRRLRRKRGSAS